jgi:hypothetical protein
VNQGSLVSPGRVWIKWVWQFEGQCWSTSVQVSAEAAKVPSCESVAWPENGILSPTFHVRFELGESITGVGGVLFTLMVSGALVVVAPWLSETRRRTVYVPGVE